MNKKIRQLFTKGSVQTLLYHFIRKYSWTFRFRVANESDWLNYYLNEKGGVLLCVYHQQFFSAIRYFKNYAMYHPALMISQSKDGEIISGVANRTGWHTARGSSSKGGAEALRWMIDHLKKYRLGAHIVDGPRGPATIVKPGAIQMARSANTVIVPFYTVAENAWYFNSWDNFFIPKPFSKVTLHYGEMIRLGDVEDEEAFELKRKFLEDTMRRENARLQKNVSTKNNE